MSLWMRQYLLHLKCSNVISKASCNLHDFVSNMVEPRMLVPAANLNAEWELDRRAARGFVTRLLIWRRRSRHFPER
jgi:hypothetical protein